MNRPNKNALALAGEFAVLSELALRGYDANMTLGHTKGVDILVSNPKTNKMFKLEVKTKFRDSDKKHTNSTIFGRVLGQWMMNKKHEKNKDSNLSYCFVLFNRPKNTVQFFIVPSRVVANYVEAEHKLFLKVKRHEGIEVKNTDMRLFRLGFRGQPYSIRTPFTETYEIQKALGASN